MLVLVRPRFTLCVRIYALRRQAYSSSYSSDSHSYETSFRSSTMTMFHRHGGERRLVEEENEIKMESSIESS